MTSPLSTERAETIRLLLGELKEMHGADLAARLEVVRAGDPELGSQVASLLSVAKRQTGVASEHLDRLLRTSAVPGETVETLAGRTVSHFRIAEQLGRGETGIVYRAEDVRLGRNVALKFLPRSLRLDEKARGRIVQEARTLSQLDHPNVCTVYEVDQAADGRTFIAMPCYEGETVAKRIERGDLGVDDAVGFARQVLSGLEAAHSVGIIHRDIKPENLFVTNEGTVKILDFGLAKLVEEGRTSTNAVRGMAAYTSPEQVRGESVDRRTDLWSFGVVLYEMLSGECPFRGAYEFAVLYSVLHAEAIPLPNRVPDRLRRVVDRCLRKQPADRFASASETAAALAEDPSNGRTAPAERLRMRWAAAVLLILVIAVGIAVTLLDLPVVERFEAIIGVNESDASVRHLAVLPFTSYGGDERNNAFAEGLFEILTSRLSQMNYDSIWVVPAVDIRDEQVRSVDAAHDLFGISFAVTGSLHWTGEAVRVTLNLVDAVTLRQLDSRLIDGHLSDAEAFERTVTNSLAAMIGLRPPDPGPGGRIAELFGVESDRSPLGATATLAPGAYEYYLTGRGYLKQYDRPENLDAAIELFLAATAARPDFALAHASLAEAYWRKYEFSRDEQFVPPAMAHADTASQTGGDLEPVLVSVGIVQRGVGRYEASRQSLNRALDLDERNADAHRELARTYERLASERDTNANLLEAEAHLKRSIDLRPEYWAAYHDLGVFLARQQRFEEAIAAYERASALVPRNARIYGMIAAANWMVGRFGDAAEAFERALELETDYRTYVNLGIAYFLEGEYEKAVDVLEKAVADNDTNYLTWAALGEAYYWSDASRDSAGEAFRRAIELAEKERAIDDRDALPPARMAAFHAYRGEMERALQLAEEVLAMNPRDGEVFAHLGEVHALAGNDEQAESYVRRALEHGFAVDYIERSPLLGRYAGGVTILPPGGV